MALQAVRSLFPSCCACEILSQLTSKGLFGASSHYVTVPKGEDKLYLDILTQAQKDTYGKELEGMGYTCIKIFKGSHGNYNLYLYASPRADKDGVINNPGGVPQFPKSETPMRDALGRFMKKRFMEKM